MKNKKNPVRQLRESDIKRIKKEAADDAIRHATVIFLSVMRKIMGTPRVLVPEGEEETQGSEFEPLKRKAIWSGLWGDGGMA